ncbi:MAG: hypothetical protein ABIC57_02305, partial [bacterium]
MKEKNEEEFKRGKLDITPTKRILWSGVAVCKARDAITEIQDNLIDYIGEKIKKNELKQTIVKSDFNLSPEQTKVTWNMGIPLDRRLPLLRPGLHKAEDSESIGTWSLGGKIAIHSLGDDITIKTCVPEDDKVTIYHFPSGWLVDSNGDYNESNETDWTVI